MSSYQDWNSSVADQNEYVWWSNECTRLKKLIAEKDQEIVRIQSTLNWYIAAFGNPVSEEKITDWYNRIDKHD